MGALPRLPQYRASPPLEFYRSGSLLRDRSCPLRRHSQMGSSAQIAASSRRIWTKPAVGREVPQPVCYIRVQAQRFCPLKNRLARPTWARDPNSGQGLNTIAAMLRTQHRPARMRSPARQSFRADYLRRRNIVHHRLHSLHARRGKGSTAGKAAPSVFGSRGARRPGAQVTRDFGEEMRNNIVRVRLARSLPASSLNSAVGAEARTGAHPCRD